MTASLRPMITLFYYDQRIRHEGYDIEWMSSVVGAVQGDTTGSILSIGDLIKEPIIKGFEQSGVKLPELIPGLAQLYSGALVARDIWNAAGGYAECF